MTVSLEEAAKHAHKLQNEGLLENAFKIYEAVLLKDPDNLMCLHNLAIIEITTKQTDNALSIFEKTFQFYHKEWKVWAAYATALALSGNDSEFESIIDQANKELIHVTNFSKFEEVINLILKYKEKDINSLKGMLSKLTYSESPSSPEYDFLKSKLYELEILYDNKRFKEGKSACETLIDTYPYSQKLRLFAGSMERALMNYSGAIQHFNAVLELNARNSVALSNLGGIYVEQGNLKVAEKLLSEAILIDPSIALAHSNLGSIYRDWGENIQAKQHFNQAITLNPNLNIAHFGIGLCYFSDQEYLTSLKHFQKARDISDRRDSLHRYAYEWCLKCLDKMNEREALITSLNNIVADLGYSGAVIGNLIEKTRGQHEINNPYCSKPLDYVYVKNIRSSYQFAEQFQKPILEFIENEIASNKSQALLINSIQSSGNIFASYHQGISFIQSIIMAVISEYRKFHETSLEGFIKDWPSDIKLRGWVVSYKSGGSIKPHIHEDGWMSGSLYINVPDDCQGADGSLLLSKNDVVDVNNLNADKDRLIRVKTGDVCLFPSSLTHSTLPFESIDNRVVLAFDVLR